MSTLLHWEDFSVDQEFILGCYFLSESEITHFASQYDPLTFHTDPIGALDTPIGQHCASGIHTIGVIQRLTVEAFLARTAVVAGLAVDNLRFSKAVLANQTLRATATISATRLIPGHTDRGAISYRVNAWDSTDELVCTMITTVLVLKRP